MHVNSINKNWFNDKRGWNVLKRFIYVNINTFVINNKNACI